MEDIEILKTEAELLVESEQNLKKIKEAQEKEKQSMTEEMYVLIEEMDNVLKEKSDQERNFNAVKRKMEKSLLDCQEIIDTLQKELKSSERLVSKARTDLRAAQEKCRTTEEQHALLVCTVETNKQETLLLSKKITDLNYLVEQKNNKNNELQKLYVEERNKNDINSYLKDYVEFLESEMQLEKKRKESIEFKDKVIQQLNLDHSSAVDALQKKIEDQEKELISLKTSLASKDTIILENYSTIMKQQIKINILNHSYNNKKLLAICPPSKELNSSTSSSTSNKSNESNYESAYDDEEENDYSEQNENQKQDNEIEDSNNVDKAYVLPGGKKKLILINDPSSSTTFISCMTGLEDQNEKLKKEIENWEKLLKTIDIDTYLTQIENQVDELHLKNMYESRNSILKKQLELTLRGIRQLCDYHNINMEYVI